MNLYIKFMVSLRCKMIVQDDLKAIGIHLFKVDLGKVEILEEITSKQIELLR